MENFLTQVSFKTNLKLKKQALEKAEREGITLKALLTMAMKAYVDGLFELGIKQKGETPSPFLIKAIEEAEKEYQQGMMSPIFHTAEDAVAWLKNKRRKYGRPV